MAKWWEMSIHELAEEAETGLRTPDIRPDVTKGILELLAGRYTAYDLLAFGRESKQREFMALHERLRSMGLVSIKPVEDEADLLIAVLPVASVREVVGFGRFLRQLSKTTRASWARQAQSMSITSA
jgi:hypothetical protein